MKQESKIRLLIAVASIGLMSIGAQLELKIPGIDIPFILSDWVLFIQALLLGSAWGGTTAMVYVFIGVLGLPVFSEGGSGLEHLTGNTGGYLFGFIAAAFTTGLISERGKNSWKKDVVAWFLGVCLLFMLGIAILADQADIGLELAAEKGFYPFIPIAILKGLSAVAIANWLRPIFFRNKTS